MELDSLIPPLSGELRKYHRTAPRRALWWSPPVHRQRGSKEPRTWLVLAGRKESAAARLPWAASRLAYWLIFSAKRAPMALGSTACVSCTALRRITTFSIKSWKIRRGKTHPQVRTTKWSRPWIKTVPGMTPVTYWGAQAKHRYPQQPQLHQRHGCTQRMEQQPPTKHLLTAEPEEFQRTAFIKQGFRALSAVSISTKWMLSWNYLVTASEQRDNITPVTTTALHIRLQGFSKSVLIHLQRI